MEDRKRPDATVVVPLEAGQHTLLKSRASADGQSMGIYVAGLIREHLEKDALARRLASALSGSHDHGKG
jgi:hypothetical protein